MKFLLVGINAKYIHSNPGIYSLKAYSAGKTDVKVEIAEYTINQSVDSILEDIFVRKPDAIGFSCYIWNIEYVKKLLDEVPKLLPKTDIWLGGPEVSYDSERFLVSYPQIRGVIAGEGEQKFLEILKSYERMQGTGDDSGRRPDGKPSIGLVMPSSESLLCAEKPLSMDELPFFYETLMETNSDENAAADAGANSELNLEEIFANRIIYYESQRGCPFSCSYCLSSIDKKIRYRSLEPVKKDLTFFLERKVKQVKFVDRTFNCNPARTVEILRFLKENDNGVTNFHFEVAGDILTSEEIGILKSLRPGQVQLEIGVQTTNIKTLEAINRRCDMEKLTSNVNELVGNHNIHIHLDLIAGLPFEDYESFKKSFNKVYIMRPNQLQLGFLKVLKGTQISTQTAEFGIVARDYPPYEVMYTNWISFDEICILKKVEEMVETYYNSAQFTQSIAFLETLFETPFDLYLSLARFYEKKGYFVKSPARSRRYEILLEFLCDIGCVTGDGSFCHRGCVTGDGSFCHRGCVTGDGSRCHKGCVSGDGSLCHKGCVSGDDSLCHKGCVSGDDSPVRNDCGADYGSCDYLEKLREYLTIDYYLREKPKSKPDFVKELPTLKFDYENRDPLTGNFLILP